MLLSKGSSVDIQDSDVSHFVTDFKHHLVVSMLQSLSEEILQSFAFNTILWLYTFFSLSLPLNTCHVLLLGLALQVDSRGSHDADLLNDARSILSSSVHIQICSLSSDCKGCDCQGL